MFDKLAVLVLLLSSIVVESAVAQDPKTYSVSDVLMMGGKIVSANERFVWVFAGDPISNRHVWYICTYDIEDLKKRSSCVQMDSS